MGRRNQHTIEQQREMAVAAGELLLAREGPSGLSMRKIAGAIGYTAGQLYLAFENQDDLLACINERTADAIYAALRDAVADLESPAGRLEAMAEAYIGFGHRHPNRWRLLHEHRLPDTVQRRSVDLRIARLFELVETEIRAARPQLPGQEVHEVATTLWSGVHGISVLSVTGKLKWSGSQDYRALSRRLVRTFLAGLSA